MKKMRLILLSLGLLGCLAIFMRALPELPKIGDYRGPYGDIVSRKSVPERRTEDVVTSVNFDFRGLDTMGEEFIVFVSVMGAVVLLREGHERKTEERPDHLEDRKVPAESEAVSSWTLLMTGPTVLFGLYLVTHGQLSPGGGFQGGVILATAPLLVYLAEGFETFQKVARHELVEIAESLGVLMYALIGCLGLISGRAFLENCALGLGKAGDAFSGGTIALLSLATGLEVGAGFVLLLYVFLQSTLVRPPEEEAE